jgi:hypothetical protein
MLPNRGARRWAKPWILITVDLSCTSSNVSSPESSANCQHLRGPVASSLELAEVREATVPQSGVSSNARSIPDGPVTLAIRLYAAWT